MATIYANNIQVNLFPLESPVESAADLSDGYVLSLMLGESLNYGQQHLLTSSLEDIDRQYAVPIRDFEDAHNSPSKWLVKKKNLEAVYKHLFRYIKEQCQSLNSMALEDPIDFNAIAEYDDKEHTYKVVQKPASSSQIN